MLNMENDVSVIIINYNTCEITQNCINSIFEKTKDISFEVILVDNASTDGSKSCFEEDNRITYIYLSENIGFGRANNVGVQQAKGNYIFFLNSDTILVNDAISILKSYLELHNNVGICGGNLYDLKMELVHSHLKIFPSILNDLDLALHRCVSQLLTNGNMTYNRTNKPMKVSYVTGADLMIKRTLFEEIGGFDKGFFMYYEETDLTYQVYKKGKLVFNVPDAKIIHLEGKSLCFSSLKAKIMLDSKKRFFQKNYGRIYCFFASVIYIILNFLAFLIFSLFDQKKSIVLKEKLKILIQLGV